MPFPVDRMIAILGALLEENDVECRLSAPEFKIPGEYTDMEITRVGVYCTVCNPSVFLLLVYKTLSLFPDNGAHFNEPTSPNVAA